MAKAQCIKEREDDGEKEFSERGQISSVGDVKRKA
jgi:hypothetical protein